MSNHHSSRPAGWGADLKLEQRPGVPRLKTPQSIVAGARQQLTRQPEPPRAPTRRLNAKKLPPVFGTTQLPHGLSGAMRRRAYRMPENRARHWLLLIAADRVDVLSHRLTRLGTRALTATAAYALARLLLPRALSHA